MKQPPPRLPMNEDSERAVLGYLLLDNEAWPKAESLIEGDFALHSHQRIFACIRSRLAIGKPIDLILLIDAMRRQKELDTVGGPGYISDLTAGVPRGSALLESHVDLLREKAALRRIIGACHDASVRAYAEDSSAQITETLTSQLRRTP